MAVNTVSTTVKKNLPLQDPNNPTNMVPINQPQQITSDQVQQAANQSSMQINKQAQQGFTSPVAQATSQQTQTLLKDPNAGRDFAKEQATQLAQYDRNRAQSLEAARQGMAGAGGSALNQNELMRIALQGAEGRSDLENKLQSEAAQAQQSNLLKALAEGRETSQTEQDIYNTNINALKTAIGATDIERQAAATAKESATTRNWQAEQNDLDRQLQQKIQAGDIAGQKEIEQLKSNLVLEQMRSEQNWSGAQKELDRQLQLKMQAGDIAGQKEIEQLKSKLTLEQMASEQNWKGVQNQLDRDLQTSMQSNDINAVRQNLLTQLDYNKQEAAAGRQFTAEQNALNRTLETTLKNLDITSAKELVDLKGKVDKGLLTTEQEWKAVQAALDREAATALQKGDIQGQLQVQQLRGEIESAAQKAQQNWQTAERVASQAYNTTERVSAQDFELAKQYSDQQFQKSQLMQDYYNKGDLTRLSADLEEAKANNDFARTSKLAAIQNALDMGLQDDAQQAAKEMAQYEASEQRYLQDQKNALELKMQTQGFDQEQKMAYLDAQLQDAKANNDVDRQKNIIAFQTGETLRTMAYEQGYETAKMYLDNELKTALQNNDFTHAEALQKSKLEFEGEQAGLDRVLENSRIALESKQVDMQQMEQQYNQIMDLVQQGILDPSAGYNFITDTLKAHGVDTSGPEYDMVNSQEAAKKALQAEYDLQKQQFIQTHPEFIQKTWTDGAGKEWTLQQLQELNSGYTEEWANQNMNNPQTNISPEGNIALNEFVNNALYGEETTAQKEARANAGYLGASDLTTAAPGDKFNLTEQTTFNGKSIPAGKYSVKTSEVGHGNKFFGTAYTNTHTYLVNQETGEQYEINTNKSGTSGNIISNLWAG